MKARARLAILFGISIATLSGCGSDPQLGVLTPYGEGYSDGCDSGYSEFGFVAFDYKRGGALGSVFGGDYSDGWEKGFQDCQNFMRAAAL